MDGFWTSPKDYFVENRMYARWPLLPRVWSGGGKIPLSLAYRARTATLESATLVVVRTGGLFCHATIRSAVNARRLGGGLSKDGSKDGKYCRVEARGGRGRPSRRGHSLKGQN